MKLNYDDIAGALGIPAKHIPMLVGAFLEESEGILAKLNEAIEAQNYADIGLHAHSIKGSAGNLRINDVYELALEMEKAGKEAQTDYDYQTSFETLKSMISAIEV